MRILSPTTEPPKKPLPRRHSPRSAGHWASYRDCLRWDFGFTCCFCLLHEADLFGGRPGEGLGGSTVEHRVPRSIDATLANDYANCLYACRYCNTARSATPICDGNRRLLDPTVDAWGDHFSMVNDYLLPREPEGSSGYTHANYRLDDERKVRRRRMRRELISDRIALLSDINAKTKRLLQLAEELGKYDFSAVTTVLEVARTIRSETRRTIEDLALYAVIPADAPKTCRCQIQELTVPEGLAEQFLDIPNEVPPNFTRG